GAQRSSVLVMVMKGAVRLVLIGVTVGLPISLAASRWVKSMLFGLTPMDPATIAAAAIVLSTAGLLAAYLPARRASRLDPLRALRNEWPLCRSCRTFGRAEDCPFRCSVDDTRRRDPVRKLYRHSERHRKTRWAILASRFQ